MEKAPTPAGGRTRKRNVGSTEEEAEQKRNQQKDRAAGTPRGTVFLKDKASPQLPVGIKGDKEEATLLMGIV